MSVDLQAQLDVEETARRAVVARDLFVQWCEQADEGIPVAGMSADYLAAARESVEATLAKGRYWHANAVTVRLRDAIRRAARREVGLPELTPGEIYMQKGKPRRTASGRKRR